MGDLIDDIPSNSTHSTTLFHDEALADTKFLAETANDAVAYVREVLHLCRPTFAFAAADSTNSERHPAAHAPCTEVLRAPVLQLLECRAEHLDDADFLGYVRQFRTALGPNLLWDMQSPCYVASSL